MLDRNTTVDRKKRDPDRPRGIGFLMVVLACLASTSALAETLRGTALIRERIALPADVTFEAVVEDVSRADASATIVARTAIDAPGQSPIGFAIEYDPATLDPGAIYALRATIRRNGELLFTTDTVTHVLGDGDPASVDVVLKMVSGNATADVGPNIGAHGLRLPASFRGTLPCADCKGIRHHLDLWPGQYYHLRREWLGGAEGALTRDEIGRWYADPVRDAIVLYGAAEMPLFWQIRGPDRLRQMDMAGNPILSDLPYDLTSDGTLDPTELNGMALLGMMTYFADAAVFEECLSGVRYPIVQDGDYLALERAYLDAQSGPGAPLLVHVTGGLASRPAMEGPDRTSLVVERFNRVIPGESCEQRQSQASLSNTYWRIDSLMGAPVQTLPDSRAPHVVLLDTPDMRFRATVGCNQLIGGYERAGDVLTFGPGASTMMACPPPLDASEDSLRAVLEATRSLRQTGTTLQFLDDGGAPVAELTAVYLR